MSEANGDNARVHDMNVIRSLCARRIHVYSGFDASELIETALIHSVLSLFSRMLWDSSRSCCYHLQKTQV